MICAKLKIKISVYFCNKCSLMLNIVSSNLYDHENKHINTYAFDLEK